METGTGAAHDGVAPTRSRRLIASGLALWAVWWWSVSIAVAALSDLGAWRLPVIALQVIGLPVATALILAGWSILAGRPVRWPFGIGVLIGLTLWPWFLSVHRMLGDGPARIIGLASFVLGVAVGFFDLVVWRRLGVRVPRARGIRRVDRGAPPPADPEIHAAPSTVGRQEPGTAIPDGATTATSVKRRGSIALVVFATANLLLLVAMVPYVAADEPTCFIMEESLGLSLDTNSRVDPQNGCARTIFDGDGNPAPASAYEGASIPYPGPRPPAHSTAAMLASWFGMAALLLIAGIKGIWSTTGDPGGDEVGWRSPWGRQRVLTLGGMALLASSFLAIAGGLATAFSAQSYAGTWTALRLPWAVIIGVAFPAAIGMFLAARAIAKRKQVMRAFAVGVVLGLGELVLVIYLVGSAIGLAYGLRVTPRIPSVPGTLALDAWFFTGVSLAIGSVVVWIATWRGWPVRRWGSVGSFVAVALTVLMGIAGWIPFKHWQPAPLPSCSNQEAAPTPAPWWVPSIPIEVVPEPRCPSDG